MLELCREQCHLNSIANLHPEYCRRRAPRTLRSRKLSRRVILPMTVLRRLDAARATLSEAAPISPN